MDVTLGEEAGACGLSLRSSKPIDAIWLLTAPMAPSDGPWDLVARRRLGGSAGGDGGARGQRARPALWQLPLAASIENVVTTEPLEPAQRRPASPDRASLDAPRAGGTAEEPVP